MAKKRFYYNGKRVSKGEKRIIDILLKHNVEFKQEKTFDGCVGKRNKLRFDFYLPSYHILIEYDGEHHYKPVNKGWRAKKVHESTKAYDKIKDDYIRRNGIGLLRIPYWNYDHISDTLVEILKLT